MTSTTDREGVESVPDGLLEVAVGDVIGVRTDWDAIVAGVVSGVNRPDALVPGDWLLVLEDPVMWDVSEGGGCQVEVDKGPPVGYRGEWDGMDVSIGVGTDRCGFPLSGDVVLRQPEPVFDGAGRLTHYQNLPAGRVETVETDGVVVPSELLEGDERPPGEVSA